MTQASGSPSVAGSSTDNSHVSAGSTPDKPTGMEKEESADAAQAVYSVSWWPSRTIRAASMRRAVLKVTMTEADAEKILANSADDYMLLVQGTNMLIFQRRGEQAFEEAAYIRPKKTKEKMYPTKVGFLKGSDGQTVTGAVFILLQEGRQRRANDRP